MASNSSKSSSTASQRDKSQSAGGGVDELDRIRDILVGGVSRSTDERFAALEQRLDSALEALNSRVDSEIAKLKRADATKVGRAQLAALLDETSRSLTAKAASSNDEDNQPLDKAA